MYNYFIENPALAISFILAISVALIFIFVKIMQKVGLDKVRSIAYKGFLIAEDEFKHGENTEKFNFVVNLVKTAIPKPFNMFITENLLRKVIQLWFDLCKDILDDGKLNGTGEEE